MYFLFQNKEIFDNKNNDFLKKSFRAFFEKFNLESVNTEKFISSFHNNQKANLNESLTIESFFDSWIYNKGINKIYPKIEIQEGIIKDFKIKYERFYKNEDLHPQKISILIFTEKLEIEKKIDILLLQESDVSIKEMEGIKLPYAIYLGGNPFTYAHIYIDKHSKRNIMARLEEIKDQHIQYRIIKSLYTMAEHFLMLPTDFLDLCLHKLMYLKSEFNLDYALNCTQNILEKGLSKTNKINYYEALFNKIYEIFPKEKHYEIKKILVNYMIKFSIQSSQKFKVFKLLNPPGNKVKINILNKEILDKNDNENSNCTEIELFSIQELAFVLNSNNDLDGNLEVKDRLIYQIRKELKGNDLIKFNEIIMITGPSKESKSHFWKIFTKNYRNSFINIIHLMEKFWQKEQLSLSFMKKFKFDFFKKIIKIYNKFGVLYGDKFFDYLFPPYFDQDILDSLNFLKKSISDYNYSLKEKTERKIVDIEKYLKMQKIFKTEEP